MLTQKFVSENKKIKQQILDVNIRQGEVLQHKQYTLEDKTLV